MPDTPTTFDQLTAELADRLDGFTRETTPEGYQLRHTDGSLLTINDGDAANNPVTKTHGKIVVKPYQAVVGNHHHTRTALPAIAISKTRPLHHIVSDIQRRALGPLFDAHEATARAQARIEQIRAQAFDSLTQIGELLGATTPRPEQPWRITTGPVTVLINGITTFPRPDRCQYPETIAPRLITFGVAVPADTSVEFARDFAAFLAACEHRHDADD